MPLLNDVRIDHGHGHGVIFGDQVTRRTRSASG